jgi:hypothetical protein
MGPAADDQDAANPPRVDDLSERPDLSKGVDFWKPDDLRVQTSLASPEEDVVSLFRADGQEAHNVPVVR